MVRDQQDPAGRRQVLAAGGRRIVAPRTENWRVEYQTGPAASGRTRPGPAASGAAASSVASGSVGTARFALGVSPRGDGGGSAAEVGERPLDQGDDLIGRCWSIDDGRRRPASWGRSRGRRRGRRGRSGRGGPSRRRSTRPATQLGVAAAGALDRGGGQEELAEGVGEDDRPLIASLGHRVVLGGEGPLPGDEPAAHRRAVGHAADAARVTSTSRIASRDVLAVEQDPARRQADRETIGQRGRAASGRRGRRRARSAARVTARYIAPVSRSRQPSRSASSRATVLLPAPAGPSIVTTRRLGSTTPFRKGFTTQAV